MRRYADWYDLANHAAGLESDESVRASLFDWLEHGVSQPSEVGAGMTRADREKVRADTATLREFVADRLTDTDADNLLRKWRAARRATRETEATLRQADQGGKPWDALTRQERIDATRKRLAREYATDPGLILDRMVTYLFTFAATVITPDMVTVAEWQEMERRRAIMKRHVETATYA